MVEFEYFDHFIVDKFKIILADILYAVISYAVDQRGQLQGHIFYS